MKRSHPPANHSRGLSPRPFPIRGVTGGWRDPLDSDPTGTMLGTLPDPAYNERNVHAQGLRIALIARPRHDGRWEAHVLSWDHLSPSPPPGGEPIREPPQDWPSVNGPTAAVALDALETELRALVVIDQATDTIIV